MKTLGIGLEKLVHQRRFVDPKSAVARCGKSHQFSGALETGDTLIFDSGFLSKLEQLYLLSKKVFRGQHHAERRSKHTGSSLEFADYRNYALGDDLRSIDWSIYGRLDRLFIKLYEEEQDLPVYFLVDSSASMRWSPRANSQTKFDQARRVAASLSYIALANLDRVNIFYFNSRLGSDMGMSRGKSQFHKALEFLQSAPQESRETQMLQSFRAFAKRLKQRGLVFVLSDLFDAGGYDEALSLLRFNQFEVHVIHVLDPAELQPDLLGDLRLLDAETGEAREVTADPSLLEKYRVEVGSFLDGVRDFCLKRQIDYAHASTAIAFEDLVLRVLRDGALIR